MPDDSELSDQQERVRRLLAQARVDEPMPDDVVERLDRVLARLAGEEHESPATVVELATRRRRKAATLLVAAAAVVAVGVGAGNLLPGSVIGGDGDSGAASDAQLPAGASALEDELADAPSAAAPESGFDGSVNGVTKAQYRIRPDHFADDVARINDVSDAYATGSTADQDPQDGVGLDAEQLRSAFMCEPAPWGVGRLVAVRYAGAPAVLAFRPPAGQSQVVDLLECGTAEILRSVTLPAR